ncbi:septum formation family protein [Haloechinothrix salitolerans]|uniref:Septum formation family protein n=1 Tax=Haloechinothrix salitolerans TaxID=926830 RepID=A0ABW2CAW1_9PSEU
MSTTITRFLALGTASGARYLMAGAVLGAILALSLNMALSSAEPRTPAAPVPVGGGMPATDGETKSPYDVPVGTCLNWTEADGSDMTAVDCDEAHVFEVTEIIQVGNDFPENAERPSVERWREIATKRCEDGVEEYLGDPLDPEGKYSITALLPNQAEWDSGDRTLRCGLWRIGPGGSLQATTGSAKEQSQSDIWAKGTCLDLRDKSVGDPVPCDRPHSYEIIAIIKLSNHFEKGYPPEKKQNALLDKVCNKRIQHYTGGINLKKKNLIATWDTRTKASWKAGSVYVNCKVARLLKDESGLAPITDSIAKTPPEKKSDSANDDGGSDGGSGDGKDTEDANDGSGGDGSDTSGDGAGEEGSDDSDGQAAGGGGENAPDTPAGN